MKITTIEQLRRLFAFASRQGFPLDVSCDPWKEPRTNKANAYLWAAVYAPLVERGGFSPEEWHDYFCELHFGTVEKVKPSGEVVEVARRTTTTNEHGKRDVLKGEAFADFLAFAESECAKRGVFVVEKFEEAA